MNLHAQITACTPDEMRHPLLFFPVFSLTVATPEQVRSRFKSCKIVYGIEVAFVVTSMYFFQLYFKARDYLCFSLARDKDKLSSYTELLQIPSGVF